MENEIDKKEYEIGFLARSEGGIGDVRQFLIQHQAEIIAEGSPRKINLSYKIKKETEAYFNFFRFQAWPSDIPALHRDMETGSKTLRFLIISASAEPSAARGRSSSKFARKTAPFEKTDFSSAAPAKKGPSPLSNEDLEKRIEEILQ